MLRNYIRDRRKGLLLFAAFGIIFAAVFDLYRLPVAAVWYGILLCALLVIVVFLYDYYKYYRHHKLLMRLKEGIPVSLDRLPKPGTLKEKDYTALLREFENVYRELISLTDTGRTEMTDFYTMWVHQIKTPIAAISVILQSLECEEKNQLLQELFKIERYVDLVLGYLRIDSISSDLRLEKYSLDSIARQAVKKYAPLFIHKHIGIKLRNLDAFVLTDEKWLLFVIEQLLSNSLKYTREGHIEIYAKKIEGRQLLFVEDTGIGISSEDLPRVCERGFTGFNGRMDKQSSGLGLYLCRKILDRLGHNIVITSTQGVGTIVRIDFPEELEFALE